METRSKQKSSISKSTRSAIKADKVRQAKLKELYHSSPPSSTPRTAAAGNKNKRTNKEEREPPATKPPQRSTRLDASSMAPIRIMSEAAVSNTVSPEQDASSLPPLVSKLSNNATSTVEATADEVAETPEQREARRKAHPLKDIPEPLPTDCLFGRGGGTNHHPGNKLYRKMVEDKKELYLHSKRLDKPLVAMEIIREWRELDPPGRFLKQDDDTKLWNDVGDKKAREKTSQALREKSFKDRDGEEYEKQTRFESGTKLQRGNLVTRDHSLGTEIIGGNDYFSMEGFSWDEHDNQVDSSASSYPPLPPPHVRENSPHNAATAAAPAQNSYWAPPPPQLHHHHPSPHHRYAHPPPQHSPHHPSPHHYYPPQHDYHHRPHHDRGRNNSLSMNPLPGASTAKAATNTFDDERSRSSWGHAPSYSYDSRAPPPPLPPPHYYGYAPPPPPPQGWSPSHHHHPHHHYGPPPQSAFAPYEQAQDPYYESMKLAGSPQDFTKIADLMSQEEDETKNEEKMSRSNSNSSRSIDRSNSWGGYERKHSLVLRDTSIGSFAPFDAEDNVDGGFDETAIQRSKSMPYSNNESEDSFPSPPQPIQTRKKPDCVEKEASPVEGAGTGATDKPSLMRKISGGGLRGAPIPTLDDVHRPEPVKRDTSNQPESMETKRSVKRVVLSRDKSAVSRSLKEEQNRKASPSGPMKVELIDRNLSVEINKLGLGDRPVSLSRLTTDQMLTSLLDDDDLHNSLLEPQHLTLDDRLPTIDSVAMGIASGERTRSCDIDDALELITEDKTVSVDAPSAVNEDIAAKWLKGDSFAEDDQVGL